MLSVAEIYFNHDQQPADSGILGLRFGPGADINPPEYKQGQSPKPVAYVAAAISESSPVTVLVTFAGGPPNAELEIETLEDPLLGGIRGVVKFDSAGRADRVPFALLRNNLAHATFHKHKPQWLWRVRGTTEPFAITDFIVYTVCETPCFPWTNKPAADAQLQLPWVGALDLALKWADNAPNKLAAAEMLVRGMRNSQSFYYYPSSARFLNADNTFRLSQLIAEIEKHLTRVVVNCTDCANTIVALSNLLGCNFVSRELGPPFRTNCAHGIGRPQWASFAFKLHEAAFDGIEPADWVYDSCLGLTAASPPCAATYDESVVVRVPRQQYLKLLANYVAEVRPQAYRRYLASK